jgi:translation initiation factor IF-3
MAHTDIGMGLLVQLAEQLRSSGTVELAPKMEGRAMSMVVAPLKQKVATGEREGTQQREQREEAEEA